MTVTIHRGEQRTPEWYALRSGLPTSSMFKAIMTPGRKKGEESTARRNYRIQLATEIITGEPLPDEKTGIKWIDDGITNEPLARLAYERATGELIEDDVAFIWSASLSAGASTDGLVGDDGMIEVKCPSRPVHLDYMLRNECPAAYEWQVQGEIAVAERAWCDFVSFNPQMPPELRLTIVRVRRDEALASTLIGGIRDFNTDLAATVSELRERMERRRQAGVGFLGGPG